MYKLLLLSSRAAAAASAHGAVRVRQCCSAWRWTPPPHFQRPSAAHSKLWYVVNSWLILFSTDSGSGSY